MLANFFYELSAGQDEDFSYQVFLFAAGLGSLLLPTFEMLVALNMFNKSSALKKPIHQTFNDAGVHVQGEGFDSHIEWQHFIKYLDLGNFLILKYQNNLGHYVDKRQLSPAQITFIKDKIDKR